MPDDVVKQEADKIDSIARDPGQGLDKAYNEVRQYADNPANKDKLAALRTALIEKKLLPELTFKHLSAPETNSVTPGSSSSTAPKSRFDSIAGNDGFIKKIELDAGRAKSGADQLLLPANDKEIKDIAAKDKNDKGGDDQITMSDLVANANEGKEKREKPVGLGPSTPKIGEVDHLTAALINDGRFGDKYSEAKTGVKITRMDIAHFPEGGLKIGYNENNEQVLFDGNNVYSRLEAKDARAKGIAGWYQLTDKGQSLGQTPYKMPHEKYHYDEQTETFLSCDNDGVKTKGWRTKEVELGGTKFAAGEFSGNTLANGAFIHPDLKGNIDFFRYADGSLLLPHYDANGKLNLLTERTAKKDAVAEDKKADEEEIRWTRDDKTGDFSYTDLKTGIKHIRKGLELDQRNGILTFKNEQDRNVIVTGDHALITQEAKAPKLKFDEQGRQIESDPKDGIHREFTYMSPTSLQLKSVKEVLKKDGNVVPNTESVTERGASQSANQPPQFVCTYTSDKHPQYPKHPDSRRTKPNEVLLQGEHFINAAQQYVRPKRQPNGQQDAYVADPANGNDFKLVNFVPPM